MSRRAVAGGVVLAVALVHLFRLGTYLPRSLHGLYYGYASDILVPLGAYYILCLSEANLAFVRDWRAKAALVFGVASVAEICQGLGVPVLGSTFDPWDFVMFALGVVLAVLLDRTALRTSDATPEGTK